MADQPLVVKASFGASNEEKNIPHRMVEVSQTFKNIDACVEKYGADVVGSILSTGFNYRYAGPGRTGITDGKTDAEIQAAFEAWVPGVVNRKNAKSPAAQASDMEKLAKKMGFTPEQMEELEAMMPDKVHESRAAEAKADDS